MMKKIVLSIIAVSVLSIVSGVSAESFTHLAKIRTVLVDQYYGGCMVFTTKAVGHGCPSNWVSLDCNGLFNDKSTITGAQKLSIATTAAKLGKSVRFYVNSNHKANGYCVARRLDVYF